MTLEEIQQATTRDKTLQCVVHLIRNQGWKDLNSLPDERQEADLSELRQFNSIQHELTVEYYSTQKSDSDPIRITGKSCIACTSGTPRNCQTKHLLREKVWFPNIDKYVKESIDKCIACQANSPENKLDPLQMSPLPPTPWHTLHMDFCGPFPTGEHRFVVIYAYSRFPEVDIVHSTSASAIIPKLDRILATHGIPTVIRSDNGPPFTKYTRHIVRSV